MLGGQLRTTGFPGAHPIDKPLEINWTNSQFPAHLLNSDNILDYFSNHDNPFYDNKCNNEVIRMQRLPITHLDRMEGIQYRLLLAIEPLFVIRKQFMRQNPARHTFEATPLADYYIINGAIYQAPDLCSVINARVLAALCNIQTSFIEARSYSRYHPSKGYWWEFEKPGSSASFPGIAKRRGSRTPSWKDEESNRRLGVDQQRKEKEGGRREKKPPQEVRATLFQRTRVDALLGLLTEHFPPSLDTEEKPTISDDNSSRNADDKSEVGSVVQHPVIGTKREATDSDILGASKDVDSKPPLLAKRIKKEEI